MIKYKDMYFDTKNTYLIYKAMEHKVPHIQADGVLSKDDVMFIWNQVFKSDMQPIPMYDIKMI